MQRQKRQENLAGWAARRAKQAKWEVSEGGGKDNGKQAQLKVPGERGKVDGKLDQRTPHCPQRKGSTTPATPAAPP